MNNPIGHHTHPSQAYRSALFSGMDLFPLWICSGLLLGIFLPHLPTRIPCISLVIVGILTLQIHKKKSHLRGLAIIIGVCLGILRSYDDCSRRQQACCPSSGARICLSGQIETLHHARNPLSDPALRATLKLTQIDEYPQRGRIRLRLRLTNGASVESLKIGANYRFWIQVETVTPRQADSNLSVACSGIDAIAGDCLKLESTAETSGFLDRIRSSIGKQLSRYSTGFLMYGVLFGQFPQKWSTQEHNCVMHLKQSQIFHLWVVSGFHLQALRRLSEKFLRYLCTRLFPHHATIVKRTTIFASASLMYVYCHWFLRPTFPTTRAYFSTLIQHVGVALFRSQPRDLPAFLWPICLAAWRHPVEAFSRSGWLTVNALIALKVAKLHPHSTRSRLGWRSRGGWVYDQLCFQTKVGLLLAPLQSLLFGHLNCLSPIIGCIATNLFEIGIFPLLLLGAWLSLSSETVLAFIPRVQWISDAAFGLCHILLVGIVLLAQSTSLYATIYLSKFQWLMLLYLVGMVSSVWVLQPTAYCLLFIPCWVQVGLFKLSSLLDSRVRFHFFDVKTGLAVLIYKRQRATLYDTGSGNAQKSFAQALIVPFLRWEGIRLEQGIISHLDNDHCGGLAALRIAFPRAKWFSSSTQLMGATPLVQGDSWEWHQMNFQVLWPKTAIARPKNSDSLVIRLETEKKILLLTGDIGKKEEWEIIINWVTSNKPLILQIPHHGSATSSSYAFLKCLRPELAVLSVGKYNPWNLPHPQTLERLSTLSIPMLSTADAQSITLYDA